MLTEEGIDEDLDRAGLAKTRGNRNNQLKHNLQRHRDEFPLYVDAFGAQAEARYGFRDRTLYRTREGFGMFRAAEARLD